MKKRRFLACVVCLIMMLAFAATASAAVTYYNFHGSCRRFFNTEEMLQKSSDETWSEFSIRATTLRYENGSRNYANAVVQTLSGIVCAFPQQITRGVKATFSPKTAASADENKVNARLFNSYYLYEKTEDVKLTIGGEVRGVLGG